MKAMTLAIISCTLIVGCSVTKHSTDPRFSVSQSADILLEHYTNYDKQINDTDSPESLSIVRDEAINIGTQAGFYWASNEINDRLEHHSEYLNQIDFKALLIKKKHYYIQPPVVTEDNGRKIIDEEGRYLRLIDKAYYIDTDPKFAFEPPTWREYLLLSASTPDEPFDAFLPTNKEEQEVWERGLRKGFRTGIETAQLTIRNKIARITNDYVGMVRYHILREKNMISAPKVQETYASISGGGRQLVIEDSMISIKVNPQLNNNRYSWQVVPQLPDISHLFPEKLYLNLGYE